MTLRVVAPIAGNVVAMKDVSDPVFAQEIVGPGIAVAPDATGSTTVVAPVAGRIIKMHPHAFVLATTEGPGILVHLGIDTVTLEGEGFTLLRQEGEEVEVGDSLITWNPADVRQRGLDPIVPVVVMEAKGRTLTSLVEPGTPVAQGDPLLAID